MYSNFMYFNTALCTIVLRIAKGKSAGQDEKEWKTMDEISHFLPLLLSSFLSPHNKEMVYNGRLGKKVEIFWNKISLTGYNWSILNAPGS